jgi:hypothetical protein
MNAYPVKIANIRRRDVLLIILYLILLMALLVGVPGIV